MTAKEYFEQAYQLDMLINRKVANRDNARRTAMSIGASGFDRSYNPNTPTEATFAKSLEHVWELETGIDAEIDRLINLKRQMMEVIDTLPDVREQTVLSDHYLEGKSWSKIACKMGVSVTTAKRLHANALEHVQMPEEPIAV